MALFSFFATTWVLPPSQLLAFDEDEDTEDTLDGEPDAQILLDRQRDSLNRPFSVSPADESSKGSSESRSNPIQNFPGDSEADEKESENSLPTDSAPQTLPDAVSPGGVKQDGQPSPSRFLSPLTAPGLSDQTVSSPTSVSPSDAPSPAMVSEGGYSGLFGPLLPVPWVGPVHQAASAPTQPVGRPPESAAVTSAGAMGPKKPEEIETIYHVPIVYNEYVEGYINLFQTRLRERFEVWLARSGRYVPMMQNILRRREIPEDLVFLALIESGFNPEAHSAASAVGPWQFIKSTGQRYGLRVDKWIDERRDPVKSTVAAARYLKDLHRIFQSWSLSVASYNAGEGRIMRALASSKTEDFWQLKETAHIKDETKNYVPKFMAATIIAKNPEKYGFFVDYHEPLSYEEVKVSKQTSLKSIARAVGVSVKQIRSYNPELKRDTTPPNYPGYRVKIPHGTKDRFLAHFSKTTHKQAKKKAVSSPKKRSKKRRGSRNHLTQLPPEKQSASPG